MKKNKPKILVVFHNSNINSGATHSLSDTINYLINTQKYDIDVVFPTESGSAIDFYRSKNINVYKYNYGNLMYDMTQNIIKRMVKFFVLAFRFFKVNNEVKKASNELKSLKYDIIYSNTSSIIFGALLAKKMKCKHIWHIREFRMKDHKIKFFLGEKYLKKFINKNSDEVLFVSKSVMNDHIDIVDSNKCIVTYNNYSEKFIAPKESFNESKILNVLVAGDIKPSKGQFDVIKSIKELNDNGKKFCLHLAGKESNFQYINSIKEYIEENKLNEDIVLYGQVEDMFDLRKKMDIGVVPSTNEALGRTVAEGMLSMLAMIGKDSGGITEQIDNNKTGLLYDGTINDLKEKLMYYYNNREKMKEIAINGFKCCIEKNTKGESAKIVERIVDKLLEE